MNDYTMRYFSIGRISIWTVISYKSLEEVRSSKILSEVLNKLKEDLGL